MSSAQIVILGRNYSSLLGMIRAAGQAGYQVTVIRITEKSQKNSYLKRIGKKVLGQRPIEAKSKYVKKYIYAADVEKEDLIDLILETFGRNNERVILLPTDDFSAASIDLYQDKLSENFLFPNIGHKKGEVVNLMDKNVQKQLASKAGLEVVKGWVTNRQVNGEYEIPTGMEYPCFTKPKISISGNKTFMKRCNSEDELKNVLNQISRELETKECSILIEKYSEIQMEFGVIGCSDGKNVVIPAIIQKLETGRGAHNGVTLLGRVIPIEKYPELEERIKNLVLQTNFIGVFDMDLYECNGKLYFSELNFRIGAFGYAVLCAGINLPAMLIDVLLGTSGVKNISQKFQPFVCLNDKVNIEDFDSGYIDWKEYRNRYNCVDFRFMESKEDPCPYQEFLRQEKKIYVKRFIKKKLKRGI